MKCGGAGCEEARPLPFSFSLKEVRKTLRLALKSLNMLPENLAHLQHKWMEVCYC